jgi:DNA mismatch repair protein MutS2
MTASTEIHLRQMRAEDALQELERFLDDAMLAGVPSVRIVHGKGEGILRKITQDYLRRSGHISSFSDAAPAEGGSGVTIATFK